MAFLEDYQIYTDVLEVPDIFHRWCAYSALAAAAQRKIYLDMGLYSVAPNLYIILNSPPGRCKKSTAMNIVRELLSNVEGVKTKSDSITKEKIYQAMQESIQRAEFPEHKTKIFTHSSLTIFANEMSLLIKRGDKDFVAALNSLFDSISEFKHSTKASGENIIPRPFLNIIGGTTPDWIASNIHEDVIEGGLSARTIIVYSNQPKPPNPWPEISPEAIAARDRVIKRLNDIARLVGRVTTTQDALEFYKQWYIEHYKKAPSDSRLTGYWNRKGVHLQKVATLTAIADRDDLKITGEDFVRALALLNLTEPLIQESLRSVGRNILNPDIQELMQLLEREKRIPVATIIATYSYKLSDAQIAEVLTTIVKMGKAELQTIADGQKLVQCIVWKD